MENRFAFEKCEVCKNNFNELEIHYINGNRNDNHKKNIINTCKYCYKSIHKKIGINEIRKYNRENDGDVIEKIYNLRIRLNISKYGHLDFLPKDEINEMAIRIKELREIREELYNRLKNVKEIYIS